MTRVVLTAVLVMGGVALAAEPLPTDEAARRLRETEEKRAADASSPATKAEVERLRKQVAALMDEVEALKKLVRDAQKAPAAAATPRVDADGNDLPSPEQVKQAIKDERLLVGMTLAEANSALGLPKDAGKLVREDEGGIEIYEWSLANRDDYLATFRGGYLVSYNRMGTQTGSSKGRVGRSAGTTGFGTAGGLGGSRSEDSKPARRR